MDLGIGNYLEEIKKVRLVQMQILKHKNLDELKDEVNASLRVLAREGKTIHGWGLYQFGKTYVISISYIAV